MKTVQVGIMGFGTVGAGVYKILTGDRHSIEHRERLEILVKRILVRNFQNRNMGLAPRETFTTDAQELIGDPEINIIVECMGGEEPARQYIVGALKAGKTVVTSNKEVLAKNWPHFERAAKETGAGLYFEATAGGGIPIIRTLIDGMQANEISLLMGIINGTTNYILTKMTEEGQDYAKVLREAQELGYAEANPEADVEAWDCVYKFSILASIAFHARVNIDAIYREGITKVSAEDIAIARELGYVIKLLAIGKKSEGNLEVRVHPTMLPKNHPLASVRGVFNAVYMEGSAVGDVMLYGRGAGEMPTASAVVSDIIYASKTDRHGYMTFVNEFDAPQWLVHQKDWLSAYFIRLTVADEIGVLCNITGVFARNNVSIHSVMQHNENAAGGTVNLDFITDSARELSFQGALNDLHTLPCVRSVDSVMRVEG